ncbi:MAG: ATP-dependent Clp protease ATP-binding subunit [Patescibacteria group bacterium]|jgi:ATP-dependent Clp protease ATP-binding subunit ClpC|nr:ATP-dependent Clp protease ATP-binding subunit [Patescibacteria group bacterium]
MSNTDLNIINNKDHGPGISWQNCFFYWRLPLHKTTIILDRFRKKFDRLLNLLATIIVIFGILALLLWYYINLELLIEQPLAILPFWLHQHPLILFFLLAAWVALFLIYRRSELNVKAKKIHHKYWQQLTQGKEAQRNIADFLGPKILRIIENSYLLAQKFNQSEISVLHFFRASLAEPQVQNIFIRLGVDAKSLIEKIDRNLSSTAVVTEFDFGLKLKTALILAGIDAITRRQDRIEPINAILFCYQQDELLAEILYDLEVDEDKLRNVCEWMHINRWLLERYRAYSRAAAFKPGSGMDRAYTSIATPTLDHFSHDLTLQAKYGNLEMCVGRQTEINAIFENIESGHNGVLLVGPSGTGKTAVIHGLAQLMVEERVPTFLQDKRLVEIDISRLVSGASPEEAKARLLACINETNRARNIVLHIANIENLIAGNNVGGDSLDLSEVLAESLNRRQVFCIATINSENYAKHLENSAIGQVMTTVGIQEPDVNRAILMLESKVSWLESNYKVFIDYNAIEQAVNMSDRYLHDRFLPAKAVDLLQSAVLSARKEAGHKQEIICSREHIAAAISELTGVPVQQLTADEGQKLLSLETNIHKRMIGQEEAVSAVAASLRRARTALKDVKRPIASFLFLGPTGVGKTELAKTVSEIYFGNEEYMIRLDMSEYQQADSVRKMIGDVDGTLGYLTEAVRKKPFALILLDEIEKAHPDILNLFLQILDDGRLTDGQGRTISFSESIIIATSNIGAIFIQEQIKANVAIEQIKTELIDRHINKFMRPELVNRFDGIIVFKPLSQEHIFQIAALMLKKIKNRLLDKGIDLKADKEGVRILAEGGYDPKFGARPLRRLLQEKVEDELANLILAGTLNRRDTVVIDKEAKISVIKAKKL